MSRRAFYHNNETNVSALVLPKGLVVDIDSDGDPDFLKTKTKMHDLRSGEENYN